MSIFLAANISDIFSLSLSLHHFVRNLSLIIPLDDVSLKKNFRNLEIFQLLDFSLYIILVINTYTGDPVQAWKITNF